MSINNFTEKIILSSFILVTLSVCLFLITTKTSAQFPSFEVYTDPNTSGCNEPNITENCTPYPTAKDISVTGPINNSVTVNANVFDVSGVYSAVAILFDELDSEVARVAMTKISGTTCDSLENICTFSGSFDTSNLSNQNYKVDLLLIDNLQNSSDVCANGCNSTCNTVMPPNCDCYCGVGSFTIGTTNKTGTSINFSLESSTVSQGSAVNLYATLQDENNNAIENANIVFTDETDNVPIGTATTISDGTTYIIYTTSGLASIQSHTLKASYGGDLTYSSSQSQASLTVTGSQKPTTLSLLVMPDVATQGETVYLYATLKYTENGIETPVSDALISFLQNGSYIGSSTTVDGYTYISYMPSVEGSNIIQAVYAGDAVNNLSSSQASGFLTVRPLQ